MLAVRSSFSKLGRIGSCVCGARTAYYRKKHTGKKDEETNEPEQKPNLKLGEMASKYTVFREEESETILDIHEERLKYAELLEEAEITQVDPFEGINLERK